MPRDGESPTTHDDSPTTRDDSPRRRDLLKAGAAAGLLGVTGLTLNGAAAQETTTQADGDGAGGTGVFTFSLEEGDLFRVRFRPRDPFGEPATETVPAGCLDGEAAEYQLFIVRTFRGGSDLGFRGLLAPQTALAEDLLETTTAPDGGMTETETETETAMDGAGETTTEAAMQDETTTPANGDLPEIALGEWYRVASAEACDGLNRLTIETAEPPETTAAPGGGETTTE
jgi:hypothetical protein